MKVGEAPALAQAAADFRLLLSSPVTSALVIGNKLSAVQHAFSLLGIPESSSPDVVVCTRADIAEALALGAPSIVVFGNAPQRQARRQGYVLTSYHAWTTATRQVFARARQPSVGRYLVRAMSTERSLRVKARSVVLRALVEARRPLPWAQLTICERTATVPFILAAAGKLDPTLESNRFHLECPRSELMQRLLFHVHGDRAPVAIVKTCRHSGQTARFAGDATGLVLAASFGAAADAHAPKPLGRGVDDASGLDFVAESAAPGHPLSRWMAARTPRLWIPEQIDSIVRWIGDRHEQSRDDSGRLAELDALIDLAPPALATRLEAMQGRVPGVLGHRDLGSWNILCTPTHFTIVDWESARRPSPPLWDLWYFLMDVLPRREAPNEHERWMTLALDMFRGEHLCSVELFAHTNSLANRMGVCEDDVGPLLAACWLHHRQSRVEREQTTISLDGMPGARDHLSSFADSWFDDSALGVTWDAYASRDD